VVKEINEFKWVLENKKGNIVIIARLERQMVNLENQGFIFNIIHLCICMCEYLCIISSRKCEIRYLKWIQSNIHTNTYVYEFTYAYVHMHWNLFLDNNFLECGNDNKLATRRFLWPCYVRGLAE
jgi:hypothetical protein